MGVEKFNPGHCAVENCCINLMQPFINHINGFKVNLIYADGGSINIAPWEVSEVIEDDDKWTAVRQNTQQYEELEVSLLTLESRRLYSKHHHWGTYVVEKSKKCPFR